MSAPLLTTKLHTPRPHHDLVSRPLLIKRLNAGLPGKLTLVATPAGFGKTTLISSWIRTSFQTVTWFPLDKGDNDPSIFWVYLVSALQQECAKSNQTLLATFNPVQLPPIQTLLTTLINELAASQVKIVLVLDDYHVISNPQIHTDLTYRIDKQLSSLHIGLLTRADPPLPIVRLRGCGLLTGIRSADLKFSLTETKIFLNEISSSFELLMISPRWINVPKAGSLVCSWL